MKETKSSNFYKSSFSGSYGCVGVKKEDDKIFVTNTKTQNNTVEFTPYEWKCFIEGVKAGEFDKFAR